MSSIIDPRRDSGQALVLFVFGLVVFLGFAALVFDVGQTLVDRRAQQDAADAAALAGARYLTEGSCQQNSTPSNCPKAVAAAVDVAQRNGYVDGQNGIKVNVLVPPGSDSQFAGVSGYIEVQIRSTKAAIFEGALGLTTRRVATTAVAANQSGIAAPYSFLALNPTACPSALFSGQAILNVGGNIQVDSSCTTATGAMQVVGQADVTVTVPQGQCAAVGTVVQGGSKSELNCTRVNGAQHVPDPLQTLPAPPLPQGPTPAMVQVSGTSMSVPNGCPGSLTAAPNPLIPAKCSFPSAYKDTSWRVFPGYYPGGLNFSAGTFYLEPGIYYLGGGGFSTGGNGATVISVAPGGTTLGGGLLLYNTQDPGTMDPTQFAALCLANPGYNAGCLGQISMNGSSSSVQLDPLADGSVWSGLVIFQDRTLSMSSPSTPLASRTPDVSINGNTATVSVVGTIYEPAGYVSINGNGGYNANTQVIADEFRINGSSGQMNVNYGSGSFYQFSGVGLVQ